MSYSSPTLQSNIVPLLVDRFQDLTSLSLIWAGVSIPDSALGKVGSLKTLSQIHLSTGNQFGWKHDWLINHKSLRRYLGALPLLQKIAFSRDSYNILFPMSPKGSYYSEVERIGTTGESQHCQWMFDEASKYVSVIARLEWIYFGQILMNVATSDRTTTRSVRALSEERDSCYTLQKKMFGGTADWDLASWTRLSIVHRCKQHLSLDRFGASPMPLNSEWEPGQDTGLGNFSSLVGILYPIIRPPNDSKNPT